MNKLIHTPFRAQRQITVGDKLAIKTTKNRIAMVALYIFFTAPAWAEWSYVNTSENGDQYYLDYATLRKDGNMRKIWELRDRKKKGKNGQMSELSRSEYDCKEERFRFLAFIDRGEAMGEGKTLSGDDRTTSWMNVGPETVSEAMLKKVCFK